MRKEGIKGFALCNVVCYDGVKAYVTKLILEVEDLEVTAQAECLAEDYLQDLGLVLKVDVLYKVDLYNILAFKDTEVPELVVAFSRFNEMYF